MAHSQPTRRQHWRSGDILWMYGPIDRRPYEVFSNRSSVTPVPEAEQKPHAYVLYRVSIIDGRLKALAFACSSFSDRTIGSLYAPLAHDYRQCKKDYDEKLIALNKARHDHEAVYANNDMRYKSGGAWREKCSRTRRIQDSAADACNVARQRSEAAQRPYKKCKEIKDDCLPAGNLHPHDEAAGIYTVDDVVSTERDSRRSRGYWNAAFVIYIDLDLSAPEILSNRRRNRMNPQDLGRLVQLHAERKAASRVHYCDHPAI